MVVELPGVGVDQVEAVLEHFAAPQRLGRRELDRLQSLRRRSVRPDERGLIRFEGLEPGAYRLEASAPGAAPRRLEPIDVPGPVEVLPCEPIVLRAGARLTVAVKPSADRFGNPWIVELAEAVPMAIPVEPVLEVEADPLTGRAVIERVLPESEYEIRVRDRRHEVFHRELRQLDAGGDVMWEIDLDQIKVEGTVFAGGEPVAVSLRFSQDKTFLHTESNEVGEFTLSVSRPGEWFVEAAREAEAWIPLKEPVRIEPTPQRRPAKLELHLPQNELTGRVLQQDGRPVRRAFIQLSARSPAGLRTPGFQVFSDVDGRFRATGLPPGRYFVEALYRDRRSRPVEVELGEEEVRDDVELRLRSNQVLQGQVIGPAGPLPGVTVTGYPSGLTGPVALERQVTALDGSFELAVPPDAQSVGLTVLAPGFDLLLADVVVPQEDPLEVVVERGRGATVLVRFGDGNAMLFVHIAQHITPLPILVDSGWLFSQPGARIGDGEALVPGLPAGLQRWCRQDMRTFTRRCEEVWVAPGGLAKVDLKAPAGEE